MVLGLNLLNYKSSSGRMNDIHNVGASHLPVSFGDALFHAVHPTLLRRAHENYKTILGNKFSR